MKVIPENVDDIVAIVASKFRTFGGGNGGNLNPIAEALKNNPPSFAAGVDVREVVNEVIEQYKIVTH